MKKTRIKDCIIIGIMFAAIVAGFTSFMAIFLNKNPYISGAVCLICAVVVALIAYANMGDFE